MKKKAKKVTSKTRKLAKKQEAAVSETFVPDSTAVIDVQNLVEEDKGSLLGDRDLYEQMGDFISNAPGDESRCVEDRINEGKDLLKNGYGRFNLVQHTVEGTFTHYAIRFGKVLNVLKPMVGKGWEAWSAQHLAFMSESNRQVYMRLAAIPGIEKHACLGLERCQHIVSVYKDKESEDPIGDFLSGIKIPFDPIREPKALLGEFKTQIDSTIFVAKAKKHGVDVDLKEVKKLLEIGVKADNQLLRNLAMIKSNGGDTSKYLETLHLNQGQEEEFLDSEKRIEGFKKLVVRLNATIDSILANPELLGSVDSETIQSLEEKIAALKEKVARK